VNATNSMGGAYFQCSDALEVLELRTEAGAWTVAPEQLLVRAVMAVGYGLLAVADQLEENRRAI